MEPSPQLGSWILATPFEDIVEIFFDSGQGKATYLTTQLLDNGVGVSNSGVLVQTKAELEEVPVHIHETTFLEYSKTINNFREKGLVLLTEVIVANEDKLETECSLVVTGAPQYEPDYEKEISSDYDRIIIAALVDTRFEATEITIVYYLYKINPYDKV